LTTTVVEVSVTPLVAMVKDVSEMMLWEDRLIVLEREMGVLLQSLEVYRDPQCGSRPMACGELEGQQ
jgi:hypothetical protein